MIELPQKLAGLLGGLGFLTALLVGVFNVPSRYGIKLVVWRSVVLFLIFVGLGWLLGTLIARWTVEEDEEGDESHRSGEHIDRQFSQEPEELDALGFGSTATPDPEANTSAT